MFPFSRMFDWYHGHSFADGLYESADGKNDESSSEDAFFAYAMKMWGHVIGDPSMEARGNLMLSILARTLDNYFLMSSNNENQPANFIGNKVTGIVRFPSLTSPRLNLADQIPTALRKQDRSYNLFWRQPGIHPRHSHAPPQPLHIPNAKT